MISPTCAIIMDVTSTTSSYNTLERSVSSEHVDVNVGDSMDGSTENELLEEPNHDPEDEDDTLSDDSMRLRLSDDEADVEARRTDEPTVPHVSSEKITSRDTDMGLSNSDDKLPIADDSLCPESETELQDSPRPNDILSETLVSGNKNINMWPEKNPRELSSIGIANRSIKRSLTGQPHPARYNHSHSTVQKSPPYFNNQDNFGKPSSYRNKNAANCKYSKQKYLHSSSRNEQRNTVEKQEPSPESEICSKSNEEMDLPRLSQSSVLLSNSVGQGNGVNSDRDTVSPTPLNNQSVIPQDEDKTDIERIPLSRDSQRSVNYELARECSHLNLDKEPTSVSKSCENTSSGQNLVNCGYDSKFTSDDWFDELHNTKGGFVKSSETPSSSLYKNCSSSRDVGALSPVCDTESAVSVLLKTKIPIDDGGLSENSNIDSFEAGLDTCPLSKGSANLDVRIVSNDAKVKSDITKDDAICDVQTKFKADDSTHEATKESNEIIIRPESPKVHETEATFSEPIAAAIHLEKIDANVNIVEQQAGNLDEVDEKKVINQINDSSERQESNIKVKVENEEKTKIKVKKISLSDEQTVKEQPMDIDTESQITDKDAIKQCQKSCEADIENGINLQMNVEPATMTESLPEQMAKLKSIREHSGASSVDSEPSDYLESITTEESNANEKSSPSKSSSSLETNVSCVSKRTLADTDTVTDKSAHKKMKITSGQSPEVRVHPLGSETEPGLPAEDKKVTNIKKSQETPKSLHYVRKFFQRDMKGKLSKLKREELEELIIQKLVETITMRSEIGRLREQARASERNQEATRVRCQQLSKQIKDFEMVLNRNTSDRRSNNNKPVAPIKINRSVGLQVNFVTDHGIQSLRALSTNNAVKPSIPNAIIVNGGNRKSVPEKLTHTTTAPRRGIKVRSPRRIETPKNPLLPIQTQTASATPAALVISKAADALHNSSTPINSKEQTVQNAQSVSTKVQNIIPNTVNGKIPHLVSRQAAAPINQKPESNDLIDLTEEEDKSRTTSSNTSGILPMVGTVTSSIATKVSHPRLQRVVQATLAGNVASATQPGNIRVVQSIAQPTPTALVNNINNTRLAYVMQGPPGPGRQLLLAPNPNQTRPATSTPRGQFPNVTYKSGISTLANGSVRVITSAAPTIPNLQPPPAPLPDTPLYPPKNGWKLPPPPPSLKISKVTQGIVLSWNMVQSDTYAEIASYQLYAYQEIPGTPPSSNLWKKVGDVRALPLPMACTLKEFTPGNNYHFAVRAVDTHSRLGQYSIPRNISL